MSDSKKTAWNGSRISRRRMLSYGLAGMAGNAGGLLPDLACAQPSMRYSSWQTICIGRYLVDVPTGVQLKYFYLINNEKLEKMSGTAEDAERMWNDKIRELQSTQHKIKGTSYIQSIPLPNGGMLVQGWMVDFNIENSNVFLYIPVTSRGKSFVYTYSARVHSSDAQKALPNLIAFASSFRPLDEGVIPKEEGLCLEDVILVNLPESFVERVAVNFEDPYAKNLFLAFSTRQILRPFPWMSEEQPRLAAEACEALEGRKKCDQLRFGKHPVGPIQAEELCVAGTTYDGRHRTYSFQWGNPGVPRSKTSPRLIADLIYTGVPLQYSTAPTPFSTDAEALAVWDRFVNSIRIRPVGEGERHE